MTNASITAIVLTLNEEVVLKRALQSLNWCDEIIVLDSGSCDGTLAVANDFGARILTHIQSPPFLISEQRNWALKHGLISTKWVLFLDADEEITSALSATIQDIIKDEKALTAYYLAPRYLFFGAWLRHTQSYPNWHPRLLQTGKHYFHGGVWESFDDSAPTGFIREPYNHYAFSKGINDWLQRHVRYADWEADTIFEYQRGNQSLILATKRSQFLRQLATKYWYLRPLLRFLQKYFLNLGFLDGPKAFLFSLMMAMYDLITVIKVIEKNHKSRGISL